MTSTWLRCSFPRLVQVAKEYTDQLGAGKIIELFESQKNFHGLYYYLGGYIAFSEDPEVPRPAAALATLSWTKPAHETAACTEQEEV